MLGREPGDQPLEQHLGAVEQLLTGVGACEEFESALEDRWQAERIAWIGPGAQRAVEFAQYRLAETPRQPGARQGLQIGQRQQAHALQGLPVLAARTD